jgi:hypothetical protein
MTLPPWARRAFDRLAADCHRVLDTRLVAVIATSPATGVVFATSLTPADLEAAGALGETWRHDGIDTPLFVTVTEFRGSLDTFPAEYQAMLDRHMVIAGTPPFQDAVIGADQLRRACEVQAKGHLIHLRQGWLERVGHDDQLADLIVRSVSPLRTLLAAVARLHAPAPSHGTALDGARLAGLDEALIHEVLTLDDAPEHSHALVRRLPDYLAAAERLWAFVDGWRPAS